MIHGIYVYKEKDKERKKRLQLFNYNIYEAEIATLWIVILFVKPQKSKTKYPWSNLIFCVSSIISFHDGQFSEPYIPNTAMEEKWQFSFDQIFF